MPTALGTEFHLELIPITLEEANEYVRQFHRHHRPVPGAKFCLATSKAGEIVGVAIVGRPVARFLDDGWTLEVNRTCTNGTKNANSFLYAAAWRATKALGYKRLITYSLPDEGGATFKALGWKLVGQAGGGRWDRKARPRIDTHPLQRKLLWEAVP